MISISSLVLTMRALSIVSWPSPMRRPSSWKTPISWPSSVSTPIGSFRLRPASERTMSRSFRKLLYRPKLLGRAPNMVVCAGWARPASQGQCSRSAAAFRSEAEDVRLAASRDDNNFPMLSTSGEATAVPVAYRLL